METGRSSDRASARAVVMQVNKGNPSGRTSLDRDIQGYYKYASVPSQKKGTENRLTYDCIKVISGHGVSLSLMKDH